jgi:hypothetical protein
MKMYMEAFELILKFLRKRYDMTCLICGIVLGLHIVANVMYWGKPVPITGIVLQPWMAVANVTLVSIATGGAVGYLALSE